MENEKKRKRAEEEEQWRWWEGMSPEVLALIFARVPADMLARTVPFVCKAWRDVVAGPYCWAHIDLEEWARRVASTAKTDAAVAKLARRSAGTLRSLSAYKLGNPGFVQAAISGKLLSVLQIPMSEVTDDIVKKHIGSLQMLTVLDISYCLRITYKAIEALGKNCKGLVQLRRNMPPPQPETHHQDNGAAPRADELEAMAVANTMCGLKHLELAYGLFSDSGLDAIVTKCGDLCTLDIRGCWNVKLEGSIEDKCDKIPSFKDPWYDQFEYEDPGSGNEGENTDDDQALAAAAAAANGVDQAAIIAAAAEGGGGDGGQADVVVISDDNDEEAGILDWEDDWGLDSDESWS